MSDPTKGKGQALNSILLVYLSEWMSKAVIIPAGSSSGKKEPIWSYPVKPTANSGDASANLEPGPFWAVGGPHKFREEVEKAIFDTLGPEKRDKVQEIYVLVEDHNSSIYDAETWKKFEEVNKDDSKDGSISTNKMLRVFGPQQQDIRIFLKDGTQAPVGDEFSDKLKKGIIQEKELAYVSMSWNWLHTFWVKIIPLFTETKRLTITPLSMMHLPDRGTSDNKVEVYLDIAGTSSLLMLIHRPTHRICCHTIPIGFFKIIASIDQEDAENNLILVNTDNNSLPNSEPSIEKIKRQYDIIRDKWKTLCETRERQIAEGDKCCLSDNINGMLKTVLEDMVQQIVQELDNFIFDRLAVENIPQDVSDYFPSRIIMMQQEYLDFIGDYIAERVSQAIPPGGKQYIAPEHVDPWQFFQDHYLLSALSLKMGESSKIKKIINKVMPVGNENIYEYFEMLSKFKVIATTSITYSDERTTNETLSNIETSKGASTPGAFITTNLESIKMDELLKRIKLSILKVNIFNVPRAYLLFLFYAFLGYLALKLMVLPKAFNENDLVASLSAINKSHLELATKNKEALAASLPASLARKVVGLAAARPSGLWLSELNLKSTGKGSSNAPEGNLSLIIKGAVMDEEMGGRTTPSAQIIHSFVSALDKDKEFKKGVDTILFKGLHQRKAEYQKISEFELEVKLSTGLTKRKDNKSSNQDANKTGNDEKNVSGTK